MAGVVKLGLLALALVFASSATHAPPVPVSKAQLAPNRIVSVNLCADEMVLHLADRGQIAGLSRNAADPSLSAAAAKARGLNIMRDSAEALLVTDPDIIVAIPKGRSDALAMLGVRNYRLVTAPSAETYPEIVEQLRQVGTAVGHPARADALIADMDARLAALPRNPGRGKVAAYYQRRGFMTGTGTLIDELMERLGLVNLAGKLGKPALSQLTLEEMVAARPDYLIMESATAQVTDQGTEMLHHPALRDIPKLWIPQSWTVCGSPEYVFAAESLAEQIETIERAKGAQL
ncbi:ABC transporter substrate-binding protein [Sphingomonas sp. MG17]|uniref:ABC transporter substrate-binding protein n=1 Tax=Sphingomonas tagetis TaxID=2949092 RepID=A0A9X2HIM7_9SPHN|nr:ABC transporter substrate-binding protein [Sphingomonas tagetis]MCP3729809.1 ABC transporter substrate-binding protein [Sphingomonas tagetis]